MGEQGGLPFLTEGVAIPISDVAQFVGFRLSVERVLEYSLSEHFVEGKDVAVRHFSVAKVQLTVERIRNRGTWVCVFSLKNMHLYATFWEQPYLFHKGAGIEHLADFRPWECEEGKGPAGWAAGALIRLGCCRRMAFRTLVIQDC